MKTAKYIYTHFDEWLAALLLAVMTILAFVNVVSRYGFNWSIAATDEVTTSLFVLLSMVGAAIATKRRAHLGLNIVVDFFPKWLQRVVAGFGYLLGVFFCALIIYYGYIKTVHSYNMKVVTIGMQWPEWIYNSYVPIGAAILALRFAEAAVAMFKGKE